MSESLREMRDWVYNQRGTDNNWNGSREYWEGDAKWLSEQYAKLPRPLPAHESLPIPKTT